MTPVYRFLFPAMWLAWVLYWRLASHGTKLTERKEPWGSRLLAHTAVGAGGDHALARPHADSVPERAAVRVGPVAVLGRGAGHGDRPCLHGLGPSSPGSQLERHRYHQAGSRADHDGPLRARAPSDLHGLAVRLHRHGLRSWRLARSGGDVLAWAALWWKLRIEERWMSEQFGERYQDYKRRVPALVPFWPVGRGP